jgi:hypothetical protein
MNVINSAPASMSQTASGYLVAGSSSQRGRDGEAETVGEADGQAP